MLVSVFNFGTQRTANQTIPGSEADASVSDILARSEEEDGGLQIQTFPKQHMATIAVKNTGAAYAAAAPVPRPAQPKAKGKNKQPPAGMRLAAAIRTVKGAMDKIQLFHVI